MGELDEVWAEGAPLEEVPTEEYVVASCLDDGVHGLREGAGEGLAPVLGDGEGDAAADVGVGEDSEAQLITFNKQYFLIPLLPLCC